MITESSEVPRFCGISGAHRAYPAAGGLGILVGDRQLPHPGVESIVESYYRFPIGPWQLTADYRFIVNPAFNRPRTGVRRVRASTHALLAGAVEVRECKLAILQTALGQWFRG
jgi:hypothetical protein